MLESKPVDSDNDSGDAGHGDSLGACEQSMKEEVNARFSERRWASTYFDQDSLWARDLTVSEVERAGCVRETWPEDAQSVLEVGCGSGIIINGVSWGPSCIGLDASHVALRHVRWPAVQGTVTALPFRDRQFDVVLVADVLEHLRATDLMVAVAEIKRVARLYVLVISPCGEPLHSQKVVCPACQCEFHPNGHVRAFDRLSLESLFEPDFGATGYTCFGDPWQTATPLVAAVRRSIAPSANWADAICPQCGSRQGDLRTVEADLGAVACVGLLEHALNSAPVGSSKSEILLWFKRGEQPGKNMEPASLKVRERSSGDPIGGSLILRDVGELDFRLPTQGAIPNACRRPVLVENARTDWGGTVHDPEGGLCRLFENRGETDGHALLALPTALLRRRQRIRIGLRDAAADTIYAQVLLLAQVYRTIGTIECLGDGSWREFEFLVDDSMPLVGQTTVFRLITSKEHPTAAFAIGRIGILPQSREMEIVSFSPRQSQDGLRLCNDYRGADVLCIVSARRAFTLVGSDPRGKGAQAFLGTGDYVELPDWYVLDGCEGDTGDGRTTDRDRLGLERVLTLASKNS